MSSFLLAIALLILAMLAICLYRVATGPTVFDRILASGLAGTNGFLLLVVIGFLYQRVALFVDIASAYALLNFIMAIALGKYFERTGEKP